MATIDEIKQQAEAVKNATQVGENTAMRVGGALAGLADIAKQQEDNIGKKADKAAMDVELGKKADKEEMNRLLETKANTADVDTKFTEEKERVDAELDKKFDKESVAQESGDSEELVMSQKAVSDKLSDLTNSFVQSIYSNNSTFNKIVSELYLDTNANYNKVTIYNTTNDYRFILSNGNTGDTIKLSANTSDKPSNGLFKLSSANANINGFAIILKSATIIQYTIKGRFMSR